MEMSVSEKIPQQVITLLEEATPDRVRFIKLGRKSKWWPIAKETNTIRIGFKTFDFGLCAAGNWTAAKSAFEETTTRTRQADVTRAVNQVQEFFELPISTLWITIEDGDVWWCFANNKVENLYTGAEDDEKEQSSGARLRKVVDTWRNTDVDGKRLRLDAMTTKITKVASFQETICKPDGAVDILRKIRGERSELHSLASRTVEALAQHVGDILDQLHQDDFELLIELIFSSSGWRRISRVGGTQKTLDLALVLPTTGESCFVQVKSQTSHSIFKQLVGELSNYSGYRRMFFVYHTPPYAFENPDADRVTIWSRYDIAKQVISAGLVPWVLARTT
jgi:hypothetical protein